MNRERSAPCTYRVVLAASALSALMLGGCWSPGGPGYSGDEGTLISTSFEPKTVSIVDTRTGQALYAWDVPVGQQLCFKFYEADGDDLPNGDPSPIYPDKMKWQLFPIGTQTGELMSGLSVPSKYHRRLDWKLRKVPELPPEMTGESGAAPAGSQ